MAYLDNVYAVVQIAPTGIPTYVRLSQNENGRVLNFAVSGDALPAGSTVALTGTKPDGAVYSATGTLADNVATFNEDEQMTAVAGEWDAKLEVTNSGNLIATGRIKFVIDADPSGGNIPSDSQLDGYIAEMLSLLDAGKAEAYGSPLVASTVAGMTDQSRVYVYTGSETGYTAGNWYYWNGSAWTSGGVYNAVAVSTDTTLSIAGKAADAKATGDTLDELKDDLSNVYITSENLHNPTTDRHGINIDGNGVITENSEYKATDYMYVGAGGKATIQMVEGLQRIFYYTTNNSSGFSRAVWKTNSEPKTIELLPTEEYIVITLRENAPDFMVNLGTSLLPYVPYGGEAGAFLQKVIDDINNHISTEAESVRETSAQKKLINRFDPSTISEGKYINVNTGGLESNNVFFASDFIYIGDLESVNVSYTHIFGWYDTNKNWLGNPDNMNSINNDLTFDVPENAKYLKFSTYNDYLALAQIGESVSRSDYTSYGIYNLPELRINNSQISGNEYGIVVDASGGGDYTSFTQAIYETVDSGIDVFVKSGTYDIVTEYTALFGQSAVDNMADSDSAIFNGFQYGVRLRNRKVVFAPGAHLICDWTGHTVDGTHRFSVLGVDYNVEIIGLDLDSTGTFYCIHDDYGIATPYTVKYENCHVVGHSIYNANCIGGGCKPYSRHIINNCYFDNGLSDPVVRYHNTNAAGAEPEIYVSNSFFNSKLSFNYYGSQTSKMKAYVNNCKATTIRKAQESSSFSVDNVELYKWCCEETA